MLFLLLCRVKLNICAFKIETNRTLVCGNEQKSASQHRKKLEGISIFLNRILPNEHFDVVYEMVQT